MINGLVTLVASKANITSLIGARFYPVKIPQGGTTFPAVTYRYVQRPNSSFDGGSTLDDFMVDVFFYGKTIKEVRDLSDTFRDEIEDQTGTYDSVVITQVRFQESGTEVWIDDMGVYEKQAEFEITIRR